MAAFFTADTHFGHGRLLRTRPRFASIEAHDEALVAAWNDRIGAADDVWHLGDFAEGASRERCAELFGRLAGRKHLVLGNHDTRRVLDLPWDGPVVETMRLTERDARGAEHRLFLAHYPHRSWPGVWRGVRHLHGHTHATLPGTNLSCDVGVDAWHFAPVPLDALLARQDATGAEPEEIALWRARHGGPPPSNSSS